MFNDSEELCWIIFNWYMTNVTNVTLNKHLLVKTWHVTFHTKFKGATKLIRNRVLAKKQESYNFAHKMIETFGHS